MQARVAQGLDDIDSMANTSTFHRLSMAKMRSTSRTLCLSSANILHRNPFADSLNDSYKGDEQAIRLVGLPTVCLTKKLIPKPTLKPVTMMLNKFLSLWVKFPFFS